MKDFHFTTEKEQAEIEKRRIVNGIISEYMLKEIKMIDEEESQ